MTVLLGLPPQPSILILICWRVIQRQGRAATHVGLENDLQGASCPARTGGGMLPNNKIIKLEFEDATALQLLERAIGQDVEAED
jgi:hypothetical protein